MQVAFLSLEYWREYTVVEASVSKTLYFLCPASFVQLLFICKVDLCNPILHSQWRRMCKEKSLCVLALNE